MTKQISNVEVFWQDLSQPRYWVVTNKDGSTEKHTKLDDELLTRMRAWDRAK